MTSPVGRKQPFKVIEIPLNKFQDEAIPHHRQILEQHTVAVRKLIASNKVDQLHKEINQKKRNIRQLKDLMYELDTLRTQVEDSDLNKFDDKTFSLRKAITSLIKDFTALQKQALHLTDTQNNINENRENESPFHGATQVRIQGDLNDLKLKQHEDQLKRVEALQGDVQDIHGIFVDLNQMVAEQAEHVENIESNVEDAQQKTEDGLKQLIKASRYKTAAYPLTGALVGTLVGGPLGLIAGLKIGGIAALSCGIAGYTGGRFFKICQEQEAQNTENAMKNKEQESTSDNDVETVGKKDK